MKAGDLVVMDFEAPDPSQLIDPWGVGIVITIEAAHPDDAEVLWSSMGLGWEMSSMLEIINEGR